jgi:hypothetical protein
MTYFPDLTPCNYGAFSTLGPLLAVGWLEPRFDFPRGTIKRATRDRLEALSGDPWSPVSFMGAHACGFCAQAAGIGPRYADFGRGQVPSGSANILIPGRKVVYVSPWLILHYIDEHQYHPPSAFTDAVGVCPRMGSKAYFLALIEAGVDMSDWSDAPPSTRRSMRRDTWASYDVAAHQAALLWRNPLTRAWCRLARSIVTGPRLSGEPVWEEVVSACEALEVPPLSRQRVVDFLLRVSSAGRAVHQKGDEFVLPHPDGEIRVCPINERRWVRWVVRRKRGNIWWPYGAATNEAELEQRLSSALGSPIL